MKNLIASLSKTCTTMQYDITNEDIYNMLLQPHGNKEHEGKHKILAKLKKN